jgi:hypothetical protein
MQTRGHKYFAVVALKAVGWRKPRFVWSDGLRRQLYIYARRKDAARKAREMGADKLWVFAPETEQSKNSPETIAVQWIVCAVWVETIPEQTKG